MTIIVSSSSSSSNSNNSISISKFENKEYLWWREGQYHRGKFSKQKEQIEQITIVFI